MIWKSPTAVGGPILASDSEAARFIAMKLAIDAKLEVIADRSANLFGIPRGGLTRGHVNQLRDVARHVEAAFAEVGKLVALNRWGAP